MSKLARETANLALFSRSFTLGNMAAYKDIVKGLPSDVRSQVLRDSGAEALERAVPDLAQRAAYVSGPPRLIAALAPALAKATSLTTDAFAGY